MPFKYLQSFINILGTMFDVSCCQLTSIFSTYLAIVAQSVFLPAMKIYENLESFSSSLHYVQRCLVERCQMESCLKERENIGRRCYLFILSGLLGTRQTRERERKKVL